MDNANNDPIGKALGITPLNSTDKMVNSIILEAHNDSAKTDFELARANLITVIEDGMSAMSKLGSIADSSQHPRAFEVYAKMMETIVSANKDLLDLQSKIREINAADSPMNEQAQTINNNLFVGSTAELQKVIENIKNGGSST
jgi:hypothetical protein